MATIDFDPNPVRERLLQGGQALNEKQPHIATTDYNGTHNSEALQNGAKQAQIYWVRTLVLILIPLAITAWYAIIWIWLVLGIEHDEAAKYRTFSGSLIFYSWFIIGVFALSWAKYGLVGVEVAMLETRFWRANNLVAYLMHSGSTWSSPSGWLKSLYHREFHRLWSLLFLLSLLPFLAFPLSGLVFEISDGYIAISDTPMVVGYNQTNFNNRSSNAGMAKAAWEAGMNPTVPGFGIVYTPAGFDRADNPGLARAPNTLPLTQSIPSMFLAPQAEVPVSGRAWGLRLSYNCSSVRSASEFTILTQKPMSTLSYVDTERSQDTFKVPYVVLTTPTGGQITILNSSSDTSITNLWSYSEIGTTAGRNDDENYRDGFGESTTHILEYALWQMHVLGFYENTSGVQNPFNTTLSTVVEGLGSPFIMLDNKTVVANDTFFTIMSGESYTVRFNGSESKVEDSLSDLRLFFQPDPLLKTQVALPILDVAPPIGVRCVWSSVVGMADLDGVTSTFSGFETVQPENSQSYGRVFGTQAHEIIRAVNPQFFHQVAHLPIPRIYMSLDNWPGYLPSQGLLKSLLLAYGMDALELMYDMVFAAERAWLHPTLTSSREGKILGVASLIPGHETGYLVLALFLLWTGLSVALGLIYGFRKRSSDKLDGYSVFRRGADLSEDLKHNQEFESGQSFYANETFHKLPGT